MKDFKQLGLKVGLEIHIQLNTKHKLFCKCLTTQKEKEPILTVVRKLHPVYSELGELDRAAQFEYLRNRTFYYQVFKNESCLVELDEEPPHQVNREALEIALQIALLFNCEIPDEIHVMRKTVIDGSNTSGFQRTMIVGMDGWFEYKNQKIPIKTICLEEDAAAIVKEENGKVFYRLNRLGIPLVEISTGILENFTPKEIEEIAYNIWLICKSTNKIKEEIGSVRQDINVSIKKGARVEIKGVQRLSLISKVIENEIERQLKLIKEGKKVEEETRAARADGTTYFTRPLPGAARMYPETDIPPIKIENSYLRKLKRTLPQPLTQKLEILRTTYKLSTDLANQLIVSKYLPIFEKIIKTHRVEPKIVASFFVNTLKDLKRKNELKEENLREKHFLKLFEMFARGEIVKEAFPQIISRVSFDPEKNLEQIVDELNLRVLKKGELERIVKKIVEENKELPLGKLIGIAISKVRGKADPKLVAELVKRFKEG